MIKDINYCVDFISKINKLPVSNLELIKENKCPEKNNFLNNKVALTYIYHLNKDLSEKIGIATNAIISAPENISFQKNFDVRSSLCIADIEGDVVTSSKIIIPNITSGLKLMVAAHELGHSIDDYYMLNNQRKLYDITVYTELIAMLFGHMCKIRYENDFGFDDQVKNFEKENINNVINCCTNTNRILPTFIELNSFLREIKDPNFKCLPGNNEKIIKHKKMIDYIICSVSYIFGLSMCNLYDDLSIDEKKDFWEILSKLISRKTNINYSIIEQYLNIDIDSKFCSENITNYVRKYLKKRNEEV